MAVPSVSFAAHASGWRPSEFQVAHDLDDGATAAAPAVAPASQRGTPLMQAMLATVTVTAAAGRKVASSAANDDAGDAALPQAMQRFTQDLIQTLGDANPANAAAVAVDGYGRAGGLAAGMDALAQRLTSSTTEGDVQAGGATALPEPATSNLIEAFTALKAAMNQPPPDGEVARRQALSEFLSQLARSFGGSNTPLIPTGALLSVRA